MAWVQVILLAAILGVLVFLVLVVQSEAGVSREIATHIWEYKITWRGTSEESASETIGWMQTELSAAGREGWELVNLAEIPTSKPGCLYIFKRPRERGLLPIPYSPHPHRASE